MRLYAKSLDVLGNLDNLTRSLDSYYYGEGIVGLAGFNSEHKFGKFLANSLSATVDTTEFEGAEKLNPPMEKRNKQILTKDLIEKSTQIKKEIQIRDIPEIQANIEFVEEENND